jgi:hypothetical protein
MPWKIGWIRAGACNNWPLAKNATTPRLGRRFGKSGCGVGNGSSRKSGRGAGSSRHRRARLQRGTRDSRCAGAIGTPQVPTFCEVGTLPVEKVVGAPGVEPGTFCTPSKRATRLRYAPTKGEQSRWVYHGGGGESTAVLPGLGVPECKSSGLFQPPKSRLSKRSGRYQAALRPGQRRTVSMGGTRRGRWRRNCFILHMLKQNRMDCARFQLFWRIV